MNRKLIEINMRAQESVATIGNYDRELQELIHADITQQEIKEYRHRTPDLSYIANKLEEDGQAYNMGFLPELIRLKNEGLEYPMQLEQMIDDFIQWKPNYADYNTSECENIDLSFNTKGDIQKLGGLQKARIQQIKLIKEIIKVRRKTTKFYYGDKNCIVEDCTEDDFPYLKYKKIIEMIKSSGMDDGSEVVKDINFKREPKPYSFNRCLEKSWIPNKRWTRVVNGTRALKTDLYLALAVTFYLGIGTLEDVEKFLNCFGISLNSACEIVNTVPVAEIKKAIEVGIHYDNIIYYLRRKGMENLGVPSKKKDKSVNKKRNKIISMSKSNNK